MRALAWTIGSSTLFEPAHPAWKGALRDDAWAEAELSARAEQLLALDRAPDRLAEALGDPHEAVPLGHTFEKLVLFWQGMRPEVRAATRGLHVRSGGRTLGEFDVVVLRHDGVIETLEVTVKFYLNLNPALGMAGVLGPRAFDRMDEKWAKMTTRQRLLGTTEAGRVAIGQWLTHACAEARSLDSLVIENHAISRGYVFHPSASCACPSELSPTHLRGCWQTDRQRLPEGDWRALAGREWLGPYRGPRSESGWPLDPRMPRMLARGAEGEDGQWSESERIFLLRADSGLLAATRQPHRHRS
ncbi:MAG: DUF1853 family protein [Casimicrobiaceae bacterium]